jgi:hydroxybutyrate-dimer hydrolase
MPIEPDCEWVHARPTPIVAERRDVTVPVNNSARAYTTFNPVTACRSSPLGYVEAANARPSDAFLPFSGFDTRFVPLHAYFNQAMNSMYARLTANTALPGSQVVRATARGGNPGAAPALTPLNVPPIAATPAAADAIGFTSTAINVPQ